MDAQAIDQAVLPETTGSKPTNLNELSRLGVEARRRNRLERLKLQAQAVEIPVVASMTSQPIEPAQEQVIQPSFLAKLRDVARARMDQLNALMEAESDPQKLDRLASAWSKLAEQERIADGRPLPGSRKPAPEPRTRQASAQLDIQSSDPT